MLEKLASSISSEVYSRSFIGLSMELCMDEVCQVRIAAGKTIGHILVIFKNQKEFSTVLEFVTDMQKSRKYSKR